MDDALQESSDEMTFLSPDVSGNTLDSAMQRMLRPIQGLLQKIEAHLATRSAPDVRVCDTLALGIGLRSPADEHPSDAESIAERIDTHFKRIEHRLADFQEELRAALDLVAAGVSSQTDFGGKAAQDLSHDTWQRMFLGEELCGVAALASTREQLVRDVLDGVDAARTFAAQMMLVQSATVDQMPELLKHVGEAYYRWRPRTSPVEDTFEKALANWLTRRAESVGLRNTIQLVRPGERFESSRHLAEGRGVEIVAVHGWVVLRDGNKVYTRANVSVK